jgi:hypothetical protein
VISYYYKIYFMTLEVCFMVKHVVMWTLKDKAKAAELKIAIESMKGKISSLVDVECGINFNTGKADCDLILISVHKSPEDLDVYQADPVHKEIGTIIGSCVSSRHAVDFEY